MECLGCDVMFKAWFTCTLPVWKVVVLLPVMSACVRDACSVICILGVPTVVTMLCKEILPALKCKQLKCITSLDYSYCIRTLTRYSRINYMDQCITK